MRGIWAAEPSAPETTRTGTPPWRVALAVGFVGLGLFLFDFLSARSQYPRKGGWFRRPPVYGLYEPGFTRWGLVAIVVALFGALLAYLISKRERVSAPWLLFGACAFLLLFAASLAVIGADPTRFVDPLTRKGDYLSDVPLLRSMGVRSFVSSYPHLYGKLISVHSTTHPPGPVVFSSYLQAAWPTHLVPRALVMAGISSLVLIPTYFIALKASGKRAALIAVLLMAAAPAPALFTFLSMDAVFATLMASGAALVLWGLGRDGRPRVAFLGGVALGLTTIMTYAVFFLGVFGVLWAFMASRRPLKETARLLLLAGAGGLVGIGLLWAVFDFNLWASWRASMANIPEVPARPYIYWVFGNPAVWLTFAGVPIAGLSMLELAERRPRYLIALFLPLLVADLWKGVFPGETERIGQFAFPFVAAAAGVALARMEQWSGRRYPAVVAGAVLFAALQAIALETVYYMFW